jgi:endonuclease YncB( thermonuclease family)
MIRFFREKIRNYKLRNVDTSLVEKFGFKGVVKGVVAKNEVHDGDTFNVVFFHRKQLTKFTVRLLGIDCPEMAPPKKNDDREEEITEAIKSRDKLISLIANDKQLVYVKFDKWDKFGGRYLASVYLSKRDMDKNISVSDIMIKGNYGVKYNGEKKIKRNYKEKIIHDFHKV